MDILAFKEMIKSTINNGAEDADRTDFIKSLLSIMVSELQNEDYKIKLEDGSFDKVVSVTHFSDCIVLTVSLNEAGSLFHALNGLQFFLMDMMRYGVLFRGGVTIGKIYHDGNTLFGPGLNEAYHLENKIAINPRVIISKDTIETYLNHYNPKHEKTQEEEYLLSLLALDKDGFYYVDYMNIDFSQFDHPTDGPVYMSHLRNVIIDNIENHDHIPSVRKKNTWLKDKFNEMIIQKNKEYHIKFQHRYGIHKIIRSQLL